MTPRAGRFDIRRVLPYFLSLIGVALVAAFDGTAAEAMRISFDVPADFAEISLKRFSEQAGCEVLFASQVTRGVRTNRVKGDLAPHEAIDGLLANTGLVAVHDSKTGAFSVRKETPEEATARQHAARGKPGDRTHDSAKKKPLSFNQTKNR